MEKAYPDISCAHAAKMLSLKEGENFILQLLIFLGVYNQL